MDFEVKKTNPAQVSTDTVTDKMTVVQGFLTGAVGCPDSYGMMAGDTITIVIDDYSTKTTAQQEAEVNAAVAAFVANKYPSVA